MSVRAKFKCDSVEKCLHWDRSKGFTYTAKFSAVTSGSPENESFFSATPTASVSLTTYREDFFVPGKPYYLDFSEAAQ